MNCVDLACSICGAPEDAAGLCNGCLVLPSLISISDLNEFTCRYPIGDPLSPYFGYCGAPTEENKPYCPGHCRLAYIQREESR